MRNEGYGAYQSADMDNDAAGGPGVERNPGDRDPLSAIGGQGDGRILKDDDDDASLPGRDIARGLHDNEDGALETGTKVPPDERDQDDPDTGRPIGGSAGEMQELGGQIRQN